MELTHAKVAYGGGFYWCRLCPHSMSEDRVTVLRHYLSKHTDAARYEDGHYVCSACTDHPKQKHKYLVIRHFLSAHTDENPYPCRRGCHKAFKNASGRLAHEKSNWHNQKSEEPRAASTALPGPSRTDCEIKPEPFSVDDDASQRSDLSLIELEADDWDEQHSMLPTLDQIRKGNQAYHVPCEELEELCTTAGNSEDFAGPVDDFGSAFESTWEAHSDPLEDSLPTSPSSDRGNAFVGAEWPVAA